MSAPRSLRAAINAMCRQCIHDPGSRGNWREQVAACSSANCPLHPFRPISSSRLRETMSAATSVGSNQISCALAPKIGQIGPAFSPPAGEASIG